MEVNVRMSSELKRIDDGGNFDRLREEAMELSKGDDVLSDKILLRRLVVELWHSSMKKGPPSRAEVDHIVVLPPGCRKPRTPQPLLATRSRKRFRPLEETTPNNQLVESRSFNFKARFSGISSQKRRRVNDKNKRERRKLRIYTDKEKEQLKQRGLSLDLSEEVRAKLQELGGSTDPVRVIIKHLYPTDLSYGHGRFNLPKGQLVVKPEEGGGFLTEAEWKALENEETMAVRVVGPRCTEPTSMTLKIWKQTSGSILVLCKGWAKLLIKYEKEHPGVLNEEDGVQLWVTRCNEGRDLLLALQVIQAAVAAPVDVGGGDDEHE